MAIGVRTRPELIVTGAVSRVQDRNKREGGDLYGRDLVIDTNGGGVWVRVWLRDLDKFDPAVIPLGTVVSLVVTIDEGQSASASFVREVTLDDIDRLVSATGLVASK